MLLSLVTWLGYVNPYLLYVFPAVLFITSGETVRITILLYYIRSTYDNFTEHKVRLVFVCSTAVISIPQMLPFGIY